MFAANLSDGLDRSHDGNSSQTRWGYNYAISGKTTQTYVTDNDDDDERERDFG